MRKIYFALAALLLLWACSKEDYLDGLWLSNEGHSDCLMSTDAEYLATKEIQTDSIVVAYDGYSLHLEHHNMILDCNKYPEFQNYVLTIADTLVLVEYVGNQGQSNCFCLYDNWFDVNGVLPEKCHWLKVVKEYDWQGERKSYTMYLNSLAKSNY